MMNLHFGLRRSAYDWNLEGPERFTSATEPDELREEIFFRQGDELSLDLKTATEFEGGGELRLNVKGSRRNNDQSEPYDLGNGYGHLAVSVDDLDTEHARFEAEGLAPRKLVDFAPAGETVARFFFVADPDGYQIEVLQRGGRFK